MTEEREVALATRLLQFEETLTVVAREGTPHVMCTYLYDLAGLFLWLLRALPDPQCRKRRSSSEPPEVGSADR
ncbi:Arginine--tRNA ligase [Serratia fonticola]|uniref:Arginine--tRNA ligase n=1 Tax=Serratia fonticola TaxID=47917 RepID=A0A4U9TH07_SERFO|nr:Arginine--tRNA ligase [Serratia fonticola]